MLARIVLAACLAVVFGRAAMAQERIDLPSRPGVTETVYLTAAAQPIASVILFPGGSGAVAVVRNNFLLRVAPQFAAQRMTVAVADVPSDHPGGVGVDYRASAAEAQDVTAIIAMLKQRAAVPVWLIGTSRGSISAANAAAQIGPPRVAGVVLTSSVWVGGMTNVGMSQISVPILVVHNRDDGCRESPFASTDAAMAQMQRAPVKQLITVSGGMSRSAPCEAMSPHGYLGIEDQVVPPIIAWIKTH